MVSLSNTRFFGDLFTVHLLISHINKLKFQSTRCSLPYFFLPQKDFSYKFHGLKRTHTQITRTVTEHSSHTEFFFFHNFCVNGCLCLLCGLFACCFLLANSLWAVLAETSVYWLGRLIKSNAMSLKVLRRFRKRKNANRMCGWSHTRRQIFVARWKNIAYSDYGDLCVSLPQRSSSRFGTLKCDNPWRYNWNRPGCVRVLLHQSCLRFGPLNRCDVPWREVI